MAEATKTTTRKPAAKKPQDRKPKATSEVTVQGITLTVTTDELKKRVADWDVVEGIAEMNDESIVGVRRIVAVTRVMKTLFAGDYERIKVELREQHDGTLNEDIMGEFLRDAFMELSPNS